jgi:MFS family permease
MSRRNAGEFLKMLAAYGASQGAGHLLTTVFAKTVYDHRASAVLACAVLGLNYLPPALLTSFIGPWIDRHGSRRTLAGIEAGALGLALLCVLTAATGLGLPLLFALLSLRAVLMSTARSGYARWLKHISPPETQARRMKLFTLTFMSATTLAGLLAWAVLLGPASGLFARLALAVLLLHLTALAFVGLLWPLPESGGRAAGPVPSVPAGGVLAFLALLGSTAAGLWLCGRRPAEAAPDAVVATR